MEQEILFAKTLEQLKRTAKEQGGVIARKQIQDAFADLKLSEEQLQMIYDYMKAGNIRLEEEADSDNLLTEEDKNYLTVYLEELNGLEEPSEAVKQAVTISAMAGEKEASHKLIEIYLPKVAEIAKLYAGQGVFLEDLIGEGNVALVAGVGMLGCLERSEEAEGMLVKMIMDAMELYIGDNAAVEESNHEIEEKVNRVADKAEELAALLRRKVTIEELAGESGFSREEIEEAVRMSGGIASIA